MTAQEQDNHAPGVTGSPDDKEHVLVQLTVAQYEEWVHQRVAEDLWGRARKTLAIFGISGSLALGSIFLWYVKTVIDSRIASEDMDKRLGRIAVEQVLDKSQLQMRVKTVIDSVSASQIRDLVTREANQVVTSAEFQKTLEGQLQERGGIQKVITQELRNDLARSGTLALDLLAIFETNEEVFEKDLAGILTADSLIGTEVWSDALVHYTKQDNHDLLMGSPQLYSLFMRVLENDSEPTDLSSEALVLAAPLLPAEAAATLASWLVANADHGMTETALRALVAIPGRESFIALVNLAKRTNEPEASSLGWKGLGLIPRNREIDDDMRLEAFEDLWRLTSRPRSWVLDAESQENALLQPWSEQYYSTALADLAYRDMTQLERLQQLLYSDENGDREQVQALVNLLRGDDWDRLIRRRLWPMDTVDDISPQVIDELFALWRQFLRSERDQSLYATAAGLVFDDAVRERSWFTRPPLVDCMVLSLELLGGDPESGSEGDVYATTVINSLRLDAQQLKAGTETPISKVLRALLRCDQGNQYSILERLLTELDTRNQVVAEALVIASAEAYTKNVGTSNPQMELAGICSALSAEPRNQDLVIMLVGLLINIADKDNWAAIEDAGLHLEMQRLCQTKGDIGRRAMDLRKRLPLHLQEPSSISSSAKTIVFNELDGMTDSLVVSDNDNWFAIEASAGYEYVATREAAVSGNSWNEWPYEMELSLVDSASMRFVDRKWLGPEHRTSILANSSPGTKYVRIRRVDTYAGMAQPALKSDLSIRFAKRNPALVLAPTPQRRAEIAALNQSYVCDFSAGSEFWLKFDVTEGSNTSIRTEFLSSSIDTELSLFTDQMILSDDDGGSERLSSRIDFVAEEPGTFWIRVTDRRSASKGTAQVRVDQAQLPIRKRVYGGEREKPMMLAPPHNELLQVGARIPGRGVGPPEWFELHLERGSLITIDTNGPIEWRQVSSKLQRIERADSTRPNTWLDGAEYYQYGWFAAEQDAVLHFAVSADSLPVPLCRIGIQPLSTEVVSHESVRDTIMRQGWSVPTVPVPGDTVLVLGTDIFWEPCQEEYAGHVGLLIEVMDDFGEVQFSEDPFSETCFFPLSTLQVQGLVD